MNVTRNPTKPAYSVTNPPANLCNPTKPAYSVTNPPATLCRVQFININKAEHSMFL